MPYPFFPAEPGGTASRCRQRAAYADPPLPLLPGPAPSTQGRLLPSCGELQPFSDSEPALCETCQKTPPPWEHFRFYGAYSGALKTLLLRGKFGADPAVLHLLGRFLALSCKDLPKPDAIVPVPLHSTRLRERGFNQCQELARPLSDALGVPLVPDLLLRQHPTRHQVGLSEAERVANLKSAFLSLPEVRGKRILLVDDTYTTGTTLRRAALALLDPHAGAAAVDVAVVARTPREKHDFQYNWSSPHESLPKNS
ncbi:MAG: ComF family protein [Bilophila wadsworthia]